MSKKSTLYIIVGIFLICTRFWINFGSQYLDISNDIIGYFLIIMGMKDLRTMNSRFKKCFFYTLLGFAGAIASQVIMVIDWGKSEAVMLSIAIGIGVAFAIYITYYFTEALVLEAKARERIGAVRNYQFAWVMMGIVMFANYFIFKSRVSTYSILFSIFLSILVAYYCFLINSSSSQIFED